VDYNGNGTFNDRATNRGESDHILFRKGDTHETFFVGEYLPVDGKLYRQEVARDGAYIKLTEAKDVKFGKFRVPAEVTAISLGGENGSFDVKPVDCVGEVPLGKYRVLEWSIEKKDDTGKTWRLEGNPYNDKGIVNITEIGQQSLKVGLPVTSALSDQANGKSHYLSHKFVGQLDEQISIMCNGQRAAAPKVRITNGDGTYSKAYGLEYG